MRNLETFEQFISNTTEAVFEKRGKDLSPADAAKEFNAKVKSYGIKAKQLDAKQIDFDDNMAQDERGDVSVLVDTVKIDPKTLGAMAPVFKEIELEIHAVYGRDNQAMIIVLQYQWKHPSGSNGLSIRDSFWNGKWVGY